MTDNMQRSQDPIDVQDLQFKKSGTSQIFEAFSLPLNSNNLIASDGRRGLLYIGHHKTLTVLKPAVDDIPECKLEIELPDFVSYVAINCDCSYLALAYSQSTVHIYDASVLHKRNLVLVTELRITTTLEPVQLLDLRWSPTSPNMLCTISSDHSIGSFQVKTDNQLPPTKLISLEALCVAWSPKGKQLAIGCRNGNIYQLKPDLMVMRTIEGPALPLGEIISLLWVSNYQFCAAYHDAPTQTITVAIVDAPKNVPVTFTCYDSLLIRMPEDEMKPKFYFEHIVEWGVIIVTTNDSAETAVLGTTDGIVWVPWIMESNARAELPMIKKKDSYPLGFTVDRTPTNRIQLDPENVASQSFPILHILGTSGLLVSFHIINLKPRYPNICVAPTENVTIATSPPVPVSNLTFSPNVSSTPVVQQTEAPSSFFGSPAFAPKPAENQQFQAKMNFGNDPQKTPKATAFFGMGQKIVETKNIVPPPVEQPKATGFSLQRDPSRIEMPKASDPVVQETKPEPVKETPKPPKPVVKATPEKKYDDAIYLRAYKDELAYFEKELESRREYVLGEVGTDEEKQMLVNKTLSNEDQLLDLTTALSNELACTKSQLLQSFSWLVEAKSRKMSSSSVGERNKSESSKMKARENSLYYLRSQIQQINNTLDLKWMEKESSQKEHRMKIPNLEFLYMTLLRQEQVVNKEKANLELVAKKVKSMGKQTPTMASLNQSLSNLSVSLGDEYGIEMRCKAIATKEKNFSRSKKVLLKDLLFENEPRIIKPVSPSLVQDRLNATLTSLASSVKPSESVFESQPKPRAQLQPKVHQPPLQQVLQQPQSPLPSLNNLISRLGSEVAPLQSSFQMTPTPATPKVSSFSPVGTQALPKAKPTVAMTSGLPQTQALSSFPKLDSLKFSTSTPMKPVEPAKEGAKPPQEQQLKESKGFPNFSMKPVPQSTETVPKTTHKSFVAQKSVFGGSVQPGATNLFGAKPAGTFSFSGATTAPPPATQASQPATLSLGGLSMGLQQPEFSVSSVQNTSAAPAPVMTSPLVFKTPQTSLFAKTVPATTSSPSSIASGMVITPAFCRSTTTSVTTAGTPDKVTSTTPANTATPPSAAPAQSVFNFAPQSVITAPSAIVSSSASPSTPSTGSMFGLAAAPTTTAATAETATTTAPSVFSFLSGAISAATSTASTSMPAATTTTSVFSGAALGEILSTPSSLSFGAPTTTTSASPPAFSAKTTEAPPIFGAKTTTTASGGDNIFSKAAAEGGSVTFGSLTITPTTASPSGFGGGSTTATAPSTTVTTTATTAPLFGGATATLTSTLGTPFGGSTTVTSPFTATSSTPFGTTSAPSTGLFATTSSVSAFGTSTATTSVPSASTFGSPPAFSTAAAPVFGAATSSAPTFGTGAVFGSAATTNASFGSPTSNANQQQAFGSIFATANAANTSGSSLFGSKSPSGAAATMFGGTTAPAFGSSGQASMFGDAAKAQAPVFGSSGAGIFGGVNQPASPLGAGMMGAATSPVFGQTATFGSKPVFGATSAPVFGGGFGSPTFGGNPPNAGFGSPPSMGGALPQIGSPGTMDKVFGGGGGSNTFESLASQSGGLSFGSLAQKPAEPQPAQTFTGGSSFSSWR